MQKLTKYFMILLTVAIGGFCLWTYAALTYVYSKGERAGYVQKVSKRGWLFKTWEGELAMATLPGALPEIFVFSVRDDEVVKKIESTMGSRVVITYHQHRGIPTNIFGETSYFVADVRPVEDASAPAPFPAKSKI